MDWSGFIHQYGAWGLAIASMLSATLLPLSSEVLLLGGIAAGIPAVTAFAASSAGNCIGCSLNYALGFAFHSRIMNKLSTSKAGQIALEWMQRHGIWSLLGSWLPFVGDPLTFIAGALRTNIWWFVLLVFSLRIARYLVTLVGSTFIL